MNHLSVHTRRLVRPALRRHRSQCAPLANLNATQPQVVSAQTTQRRFNWEGQKLRRTSSQGMELPIRDVSLDADGAHLPRAMLEAPLLRQNTGRVDICVDKECKWACKQNKLLHYMPYPLEHTQIAEMCPHTWDRASLNFKIVYGFILVPAIAGIVTDKRNQDARAVVDDFAYKAFRSGPDSERNLKSEPGWPGYHDWLLHPEGVTNFAMGGSGLTMLQKPRLDEGPFPETERYLLKDARYKYVKVA